MERLNRVSVALNRVFAVAAGIAVVGLIGLATANMVLRIVWKPVPGSYELLGFLGALAVACGMGFTQLAKGHIAVTILTDLFPPRANRVLDALNHLIGAVFFGFGAWQTARWAMEVGRSGEVSQTLKMPFHPVIWIVALGLAAFSVTLAVDLVRALFPSRGKGGSK
jgi:TRAP-type C4-dicarboxylate transport system permease small subunit